MASVLAVLPPETGSYGLAFSCHSLMNKDTFSKSDPCVVVRQKVQGATVEAGRTETIEDDLNPTFKRKVYVDYNPKDTLQLQIAVYDADEDSDVLKNKDLIGSADVILGDLINSRGMQLRKALTGAKGDENESKYGAITVTASLAEPPLEFREGCAAELFISCEGLKNLDLLSKSDPMCVVGQRAGGLFMEVGRTEIKQDDLNPVFATTVTVDYTESPQYLQFSLYDVDTKKDDLSQQDFLGNTEMLLSDITHGRGSAVSKSLKGGDGVANERKYGRITVRAVPRGLDELTAKAFIGIECQGLSIKDAFGKPKPMCLVSDKARNGQWRELGRTEVLEGTLDPKFLERVPLDYRPEEKQDIRFAVVSDDHYVGSLEITLGDLIKARRSKKTTYLKGADGLSSSLHGMIIVTAEVIHPLAQKKEEENVEEEEEEEDVDESTLTDAERIARMQRKLGKVKGRTDRFSGQAGELTRLLARGNNCTFREEGTTFNRKAITDEEGVSS